MIQSNKKKERDKKIEDFNKYRLNILRRNVIIASGMVTNVFIIRVPVEFFIGKILLSGVINLLISIAVTKLLILNKANKVKYKMYLYGLLFGAMLSLPTEWSDITPTPIIFIWMFISFLVTIKLYEKL